MKKASQRAEATWWSPFKKLQTACERMADRLAAILPLLDATLPSGYRAPGMVKFAELRRLHRDRRKRAGTHDQDSIALACERDICTLEHRRLMQVADRASDAFESVRHRIDENAETTTGEPASHWVFDHIERAGIAIPEAPDAPNATPQSQWTRDDVKVWETRLRDVARDLAQWCGMFESKEAAEDREREASAADVEAKPVPLSEVAAKKGRGGIPATRKGLAQLLRRATQNDEEVLQLRRYGKTITAICTILNARGRKISRASVGRIVKANDEPMSHRAAVSRDETAEENLTIQEKPSKRRISRET